MTASGDMREHPLILLVDDEETFQEIMSGKLRFAGFEVKQARSEPEAIRAAEELQPDLILMDIHMPGATGTDAALALKQNPRTKGLRVAFLTNMEHPWPGVSGDRREFSKELGMEDFLEKTDDLDRLMEKVRTILGRHA